MATEEAFYSTKGSAVIMISSCPLTVGFIDVLPLDSVIFIRELICYTLKSNKMRQNKQK